MAPLTGDTPLRRFPVDWAAHGFTDSDLDGLAEMFMRLMTFFLQNPSEYLDGETAVRRFL